MTRCRFVLFLTYVFTLFALLAMPAAAQNCTTPPVQSIQATVSSLSIFTGHSGNFTVCTQYDSAYSSSVADASIVSVTVAASTVDPGDGIKTANVTVKGLKIGTTNVTITDKKSNSVTVSVTVLPTMQSFSCTGAAQTFTVPPGITQITVNVVGANALTLAGFPGGLGEEVTATLPVISGETLGIYVGGGVNFASSAYTGGFNGGGSCSYYSCAGGGASDIREGGTDVSNRIIVAGGGEVVAPRA